MQVQEGQTLWLTKYALTDGIEEVISCDADTGRGYVFLSGRSWSSYKLGRDVHLTHEGAVRAAEAMRKKKIASLRKQVEKLEALKF